PNQQRCLCNQDASSSGSLDLLFGGVGEELSLDDNGLLGEKSFTENLEVSIGDAVDDGSLVGDLLVLLAVVLRDERPDLVDVDRGAVLTIIAEMVVPHTNLQEVSRMVLVEVDSMVVLTSSVTATSRMLAVLTHTTMTVGNVSSKLSGLLL
ncbi:hypothetical protein PENTCL1PPCAC_22045, partial [Pristionchus entomophagus]